MRDVISEKNDRVLSNVIANHLLIIVCKNLIISTSSVVAEYNAYLNILILVIVLFMYCYCVTKTKFLLQMPRATCGVLILLAGFFTLSVVNDPMLISNTEFPYSYVRKELRLFIAYGLPLFLAISSLKSTQYLLEELYRRKWILFAFASLGFAISLAENTSLQDYSMSYGNNTLFISTIFMICFLDREKVVDIAGLGLTIIYIVISGSRGPLVSIFVGIVIILWKKKSRRIGILTVLGLLCVTIIGIAFHAEVIAFVSKILVKYNIRSRTLVMFLSGMGTYDSGRQEYHSKLIEAINKSPIWGLGAFGGEKTVGLAHSFYLDVFANFGYVFGGILLMIVFAKICKVFRCKCNESSTKRLLLLQLIVLIPRGFFDENIWGNKEIWIILALLVAHNTLLKRQIDMEMCDYSKKENGSNKDFESSECGVVARNVG